MYIIGVTQTSTTCMQTIHVSLLNFHREITEVYTGFLPSIHLSSECHCPPSHPLIDTNNPATCVQHPPNQGRIARINSQAHPPSFANDFGTSQGWISAAGERNINITFQLTNSLYEVNILHVFPSLKLQSFASYLSMEIGNRKRLGL